MSFQLVSLGNQWACGALSRPASHFNTARVLHAAGRRSQAHQGFTLLELSIVLVIIGLIVGAILVGQDVIKAAEVRATVGQIEKYSAAVNTFRGKYNAIPGDINAAGADRFGMTTRNGGAGRGDGDGQLYGSVSGSSLPCAETVLFWTDLSFASLMDGNFIGTDGSIAGTDCTAAATTSAVGTLLPRAKLGKGNFIIVYADAGFNFFHLIGGISAISNAGAVSDALVALSPSEAFQMDIKIDNGYPTTGNVSARDIVLASNAVPQLLTAAVPADGVCVANTLTPPVYNANANTGGNNNACSLRFRFY